jgi:hypothetical protein
MRKTLFLITFFLLLFSCEKKEVRTMCNQGDLLSADSVYTKKNYTLNYPDFKEEIEFYITKDKDTLINSVKVYNKDSIYKEFSFYYDLKITKSEKPNIYNGEIVLNSKNYNFKESKNKRRKIIFSYNNLCKDSLYTKKIVSKGKFSIKFKFENCYNDRLQGLIVEIIEKDTLDEKIRIQIDKLGVDNYNITDNLFFDSYDIDKRFSLEKYLKKQTEIK